MKISKAFQYAIWMAKRPQYLSVFLRKVLYRLSLGTEVAEAEQASKQLDALAVPEQQALDQLFPSSESIKPFDDTYASEIAEAHVRVATSPDKLGGAAALNVLYQCVRKIKPDDVIETGVAYGWSSFAILAAMQENGQGRLTSIDFPQLGSTGRAVGAAIPEALKSRWSLLVGADREKLPVALSSVKKLQLCHYDSDKSVAGRVFAYPLLWQTLAPGGLLISDDIADNLEFLRFGERCGVSPIIVRVIETNGKAKFIGILRRPVA